MNMQKIMLAGMMSLTLGIAHAKTADKVNPKPCKEKSVLLPLLKQAAAMALFGSLSFYIGDIAIEGYTKLNNTYIGKHEATKGHPGKVAFPLFGALGVWLWCHYTNKSAEDCAVPEPNMMTGLPRQENAQPSSVGCVGTCC